MREFITPPQHENFIAKNLFEPVGEIIKGEFYLAMKR